jgi:hypothetical protein
MILQLKDCIDVLKVLYPQFDFLFLLDHSHGHDCQKEDGLNVERMTKSYGGAQKRLKKMANTWLPGTSLTLAGKNAINEINVIQNR